MTWLQYIEHGISILGAVLSLFGAHRAGQHAQTAAKTLRPPP